jgi:DUF2934 family protein
MEGVSIRQGEKKMADKKETVKSPALNGSGPTEDEIRKRAYELYQERDGGPGNALEDWLQAEAELKLRSGAFL